MGKDKKIKAKAEETAKAEKKVEAEETKAEEIVEAEVKETAENKEEKKKISTKSLVFRCVASVLCTAVVCASIANSVAKMTDANVKIAELTPAQSVGYVQTSGQASSGSSESAGGESFAVSGADSITADDSGSSSSSEFDVPSTDSSSASSESAGAASESKPAANADASSMNKAQIVTLFNNAANGAKANAKSIKQNYTKNTQVTGIELKNKMLASLADSLIKANMGEDKNKHDKTYTGADKAKFFPVAEQSWASKLTEADVKEAKITESNGTYSVTINVLDDTQPNLKAGEGHAGKVFSLVTKEQIVEGAGSAGMAVIKEESIKVSHSKGVIKATIDKATGKLKTANYYRVWKLELTALSIDVGISFGIEEDFVINW